MNNYIQPTIDALQHRLDDCEPDLIRLYALLAVTRGQDTTMEDVHDAWAIWTAATRPDHTSLVPFDDLPLEIQELDRPYVDAIHETSKETTR